MNNTKIYASSSAMFRIKPPGKIITEQINYTQPNNLLLRLIYLNRSTHDEDQCNY